MSRRLPIYLVLDCSGSMMGQPIESVRQGLRLLEGDLNVDPHALETAYVSVITFAGTAQQVCQLTEIGNFQTPVLDASGSTMFGQALQVLESCIDREVRKNSPSQKGDYQPLIFIMTDGQPTDSWESAADRIKKRKLGRIIACAAGPDADAQMLKRITEEVVEISSLQPESLRNFFQWVSNSIKITSHSMSSGGDIDGNVSFPKPPSDIRPVP